MALTQIPIDKVGVKLEYSGVHRWIILAVFEVGTEQSQLWLQQPDSQFIMDVESLRNVVGPACAFCGLPMTPHTLDIPCVKKHDL